MQVYCYEYAIDCSVEISFKRQIRGLMVQISAYFAVLVSYCLNLQVKCVQQQHLGFIMKIESFYVEQRLGQYQLRFDVYTINNFESKYWHLSLNMEEINIIYQNGDGTLVKTEFRPKSQILKTRKVRTWTPQEDKLLTKLYEQHPKQWSVIAGLMPERNQNQCLHRFRRLSISGSHKKIWEPQEDEMIKRMVKKVGKNWKYLAEVIKTKTGKQIRERYINKLDPRIKSQQWTQTEDHKLLELYCRIGSKWSEISKHIPGRPENKIKNRFYSYIKKNYNFRQHILSSRINIDKAQQKEENNLADISQKFIRKAQNDGNNFQYEQINNEDDKIPSIRDFEIEIKLQHAEEDKENHRNPFMRSFLKIEQDWAQKKESLRDIVSFTNIMGDHDLFYLSQH